MSKSGPTAKMPQLILFCGTGGVGKTTLAAAEALLLAKKGYNVVVFTIDPAQRLADALGFSPTSRLHSIDLQGITSQGTLRAAMLDTEINAFELIDRYSPNPETASLIKSNPIVQTAFKTVAGIEEYIALGKVFQLIEDEEMDYLVVDTAPNDYALKFLEGPDNLLKILDPATMERIITPLKKITPSIAIHPMIKVTELIDQFVTNLLGLGILKDLANLTNAMNHTFGSFQRRVLDMHKFLRNPECSSCILVSSSKSITVNNTLSIAQKLLGAGLPLKALILNKLLPASFTQTTSSDFLNNLPLVNFDQTQIPGLEQITSVLQHMNELGKMELIQINRLLKEIPEKVNMLKIPLLEIEAGSIKALKRFHVHLNKLKFELNQEGKVNEIK